jgi:N-methylhydantoinase B/oxoprolinase/acetone carboxylase alpha subunit
VTLRVDRRMLGTAVKRGRQDMTNANDPIAFELFRNAIFSIADEMALTTFRTTYSGVLKANMDYSTAFCDGDGKLVAQGLTLPGHLGAVPTALEVVVARYASARHLRLQASLLRRRADRL